MSLRAALIAFAVALSAAGAARAEPPVWVVRDKDSELLLFGSIHVLPRSLAWKPRALERALARADDVWFEIPVDPASTAQSAALAAQRSALPRGQSLTALLGRRDAALMRQVAGDYGVAMVQLDRLQPWMAEIVLAAAAFRRFDATAAGGVERTLLAQVPPRTAVRAFETPAEQVALFADAPLADQLASLRETIDEMADGPDEYAALLTAWLAGDVATLEREAVAPLREASPGLYRRLVVTRNRRWTEVLDQRLKGSGRTVAVVGMGHLVGRDSLPAALRALGYQVEGP